MGLYKETARVPMLLKKPTEILRWELIDKIEVQLTEREHQVPMLGVALGNEGRSQPVK